MPPGCRLAITAATGEVTRIRSPPGTQAIQAQDLELVIVGPERLLQTKSLDTIGNTSTILSRAINEHLISIEKQIDVTTEEVSYHWTVVLSLGIILGLVCIIMIVSLVLLYRYSSRFRRKVKTVKVELQGVGDKIIAFEREAAARARLDIRPIVKLPSDEESVLRNLKQIDRGARLNEYLDLGGPPSSTSLRESLEDCCKYDVTKHYGFGKPHPKPRNIYPKVPTLSEVYSLADGVRGGQCDYEPVPVDQKSKHHDGVARNQDDY